MEVKSMKKFQYPFVLLMFVATLCMFGLACSDEVSVDDDETSARLASEMIKGKKYLAQALYTDARITFENILLNIDLNHSEAKFAWSYSKSLEMIDQLVGSAIDLVSQVSDLMGKEQVDREVIVEVLARMSGSSDFEALDSAGIIGGLLGGLIEPYEAGIITIDQYLDEVALDPTFTFEIESLPIKVGMFSIANLGGEYDQVEALVGGALTRLLLASINSLFAINFNFDILGLIDPILALINGEENGGVEADLDNILGLVAYILADNPQFLGLSNGGDQLVTEAGTFFGDAAGKVVDAINSAMAETDDQSNDILAMDMSTDPPQVMLNLDLSNNDLLDVTSDDLVRINLTTDLSESLVHMRDSFYGTGVPVSWASDIAPSISVLIVALLNTGFVKSIIESVMSGSGDSSMSSTITQLLDSDILSEDLISGLLVNIIPDRFQFDFGAFFGSPAGMNSFFPAIRKVESNEDGLLLFKSRFLFEWECSSSELYDDEASMLAGLLCPTDTELQDSGHFAGAQPGYLAPEDDHELLEAIGIASFAQSFTDSTPAISRIGNDGVLSTLPYIPLKDASLNNMLLVSIDGMDAASLADGAYSGFMPADNYTFNAILADLASGIMGLLGDL
jgi:hypothetical protein